MKQINFRAMNTEIMVQVSDDISHDDVHWEDLVRAQFYQVESMASRFIPESELSRWNASPVGIQFPVSKGMFQLLAEAWELAIATNFKFNPFIGSKLQELGYDRSFELLESVTGEFECIPVETDAADSVFSDFDALILNLNDHTVVKNYDAKVDLGGIGKGWAVDRTYHLLKDQMHASSGAIDAGGDMMLWNEQTPWEVGIQHPTEEDQEIIQLWVKRAGIATSNVLYRRWRHHERVQHHILDGQTFKPAASDIVQATVLGPTVASAEVASKVICMLTADEVNGWMASHFPGYGYVLVTRNGEIKLNREVRDFVEELLW
ncbi:FAD:protein FMN transferase [Paenibacillus sp. KQZ6P-2]|uniref:FAD:protein FMN transferase n=1 Tax=Paenibacillus mangrovi TaxID=2931978 RepID=A0A9X2B1S8_9BACL|nr:FAD:protein FMN transferase [Paenibacillus mangrovi]MCJ8011581.1 FAD:protein FMN transferase [Paenibacillus mangrovi]